VRVEQYREIVRRLLEQVCAEDVVLEEAEGAADHSARCAPDDAADRGTDRPTRSLQEAANGLDQTRQFLEHAGFLETELVAQRELIPDRLL